jgi:GAF domain-containing protein
MPPGVRRDMADQAMTLRQPTQADLSRTVAELEQRLQASLAERDELLAQRSASAEILKVINASPGDLTPVFDIILQKAHSLCDVRCGSLQLYDGDLLRAVAVRGMTEPFEKFLREGYRITDRIRQNIDSGYPAQAVDLAEFVAQRPDDSVARAAVELGGIRTMLSVPLVRDGIAFGRIVAARQEVRPFSDKQIALLQGFADQAVIAIQNARLFNETQDALDRQTATAEVLQAISNSIADAKPVFDRILESTGRLIDSGHAAVFLVNAEEMHCAAISGPNAVAVAAMFPMPLAQTAAPVVIAARRQVCYPDVVNGADVPASLRGAAVTTGNYSIAMTPLMWEGNAIGLLSVTREAGVTFSDRELSLLRTFADQAVIAIQNARLFNETREALERQTATAGILEVIASSPSDVQPIFAAIVKSAAKLFGPCGATITTLKDGQLYWNATESTLPGFETERAESVYPIAFDPVRSPSARAMLERRIIEIPDVLAPDTPEFTRKAAAAGGFRSITFVPLVNRDNGIGTIILSHPRAGFRLSEKQLALIKTFADQAVIAIQNARLFNETQEALEHQKASANILSVISSSVANTQPVFDEILSSIEHLFDAEGRFILLIGEDGNLHIGATAGPESEAARALYPAPLEGSAIQVAVRERRLVAYSDLFNDPDVPPAAREKARRYGQNLSLVVAPMLWEDQAIGAIMVASNSMRAFSEKECNLLRTFADQAVIAIQNARLFNETREALERQTSTADILKVIASSPSDVQPVFQAIVECSHQLLGAHSTAVWRFIGDDAHLVSFTSTDPAGDNVLRGLSPLRRDQFPALQLMERAETVQFEDTESIEFPISEEIAIRLRNVARARGYRSQLLTPLISGREPIGFISITRKEPGTFSPPHVQLIRAFADQAVIAIQNTRLFNETREALEQQTATAEVLKVISASPGELEPVFQAMLANAVHLCEAKFGMLFLYEQNEFRAVGMWNLPPAYRDFLGKTPIRADPKIPMGRVLMTKQPVQVADVFTDPSYAEGYPGMIGVGELGGARTLLQVPLLKDNELVGTIAIYRQEVRPFNDKQIALVQNFAAQAVIAIENGRLLSELRQRTDDLTRSLDDLRTAQDRLVQTEKLASLGQLTAGIAHEIKNPLNFVNNFSALSAELIDELDEALAPAALDRKLRSEIGELTGMLKSNLEKVVQHGKRADSIVKNMLLHSREGGGEHRAADINALVEESLNLAYHGARAERSGFNVTLKRELDPDAGMVELYPQEITRVLLNLVSNGFYAVTKRKEAAGGNFEPILSAATKSLGDRVEIRIRDNGTGIPLEVKEKMFNPFFTTKPAGEGTGLGLSMSHDIIVKQHGGKIDVDTEPGVFTEFVITLPRNAAAPSHSGGRN